MINTIPLCDTPLTNTVLTLSGRWSYTLENKDQKASVFNTLASEDVKFLRTLAFYKKSVGGSKICIKDIHVIYK